MARRHSRSSPKRDSEGTGVPALRAKGARALEIARNLSLAMASAFAAGVYASHPDLAFLAYVGLVPWTLLYTDPRRPRVSVGYYLVSAWVFWMLSYRHTFARFGWIPESILSLLAVAGFLWAFGPLVKRVHARFGWPRAVSVPIAWVTTEVLRGAFTIGHFEYLALGYSQARLPALVQIADIVGVYGLSFLLASFNGLVADAYFAVRDRRGGVSGALRSGRMLATAGGVAAAFALALAYGEYRIASEERPEGPRVAVVQPSVRHTIRNAVGVHLAQTLLTDERVDAGAADLIVWPENAILDDIRRDGAYLDDLAWLASEKGAPIVLGSSAAAPGNPLRQTNSVFMVDARGAIVGRYDKQVLLPFTEYVPFEKGTESLPLALRRLYFSTIRRSWGFLPNGARGSESGLFTLAFQGATIPFAAITCWENVYPPVPAEARRKGARFGVHLTSESEVGGVIHEHTLRVCILRAVENRLPYVRAANTGISCFIDSRGRVMNVLRGPGDDTTVAGVPVRVKVGARPERREQRRAQLRRARIELVDIAVLAFAQLRLAHGRAEVRRETAPRMRGIQHERDCRAHGPLQRHRRRHLGAHQVSSQ